MEWHGMAWYGTSLSPPSRPNPSQTSRAPQSQLLTARRLYVPKHDQASLRDTTSKLAHHKVQVGRPKVMETSVPLSPEG